MSRFTYVDRRKFLRQLAYGSSALVGSGLLTAPGAFADELTRTPSQTEGPFYPDRFPLDTDNDLLILNDSLTAAVGEVTHLTGRILDATGRPVRNAVVEIWQTDANGVYLHSQSGNAKNRESNFQGFGRFLTGVKGEYYFRTIKPVRYPGRTPHIHFAIDRSDKRLLTTQMYVKGEPANQRDGLLRQIRDQAALDSVLVDFQPLAGSKVGELTANFDIVLGWTPDDAQHAG